VFLIEVCPCSSLPLGDLGPLKKFWQQQFGLPPYGCSKAISSKGVAFNQRYKAASLLFSLEINAATPKNANKEKYAFYPILKEKLLLFDWEIIWFFVKKMRDKTFITRGLDYYQRNADNPLKKETC
jgi:hypothetical protein